MGGAPAPDAGMDPSMGGDMGTEPMQPEDEVIDVDELTNAQEETEEKVEDISVTMEKGFEKLLNIVGKLDQMIDASTNNMEQIKREIEKRNPTPLEKLNMRAANDSYPFNVSPESFWKEKEATSNYRIGGEDEPDAEQYTITQGDIDGITDLKQISKDLSDSNFNQNLMNIFGLR
jgi:membrane-associated HD superfamily phosphohydrolase